jgi:hypothetical protein
MLYPRAWLICFQGARKLQCLMFLEGYTMYEKLEKKFIQWMKSKKKVAWVLVL